MSLSRDAGTGDYALEAGALVLADQGREDSGNPGLATHKTIESDVKIRITSQSLFSSVAE